jgi:hypothetical protein
MDEQPQPGGGASTTAATTANKQRDAAALHCYYYYKPSLAASHHAPLGNGGADDCHGGRGYFSSSEVEHSLRRLRPIRTSSSRAAAAGGGASAEPQLEKQQQKTQATEKASRASKPASGAARRPASPGARLAGLLNAMFTGKRCNSARQHPAPSAARPCSARTPPASRSRTVRFLDIDGEVAVAAAAAGCRRVPVVEVEEVVFRPADGGVGEESSGDAASDLFELESLMAAVDPVGSRGCQRRGRGDELPVYGATGVGLRTRDVGRRRPFGYATHGRSYSRAL